MRADVASGGAQLPTTGEIGRADALRAYLALVARGPAAVAGSARALGFEWVPPAAEDDDGDEPRLRRAESPAPEPRVESRAEGEPVADIPLWRCTASERRAAPADDGSRAPTARRIDAEAEDDTAAVTAAIPPRPPIVAEARLRRRLDAELRTPWASRAIDVDRLVDRLARGATVTELPRRKGLAQARLVLILDGSSRLAPLRTDLLLLAVSLLRRLGRSRVRFASAPAADASAAMPREIGQDEIVLALTDLGMYGRERDRGAWIRFGSRLRKDGVALRALMPCPAWRWQGAGPRIWNAIDWSEPEGAGRRRSPQPLRAAPVTDAAEALLDLLSPAVRVEPGLLRAVRQQLGESADLGTEIDVWRHRQADGASSRCFEIDSVRRHEAMARGLRKDWKAELVAAAAKLIVAWHSEREPLLWATEVAHLVASGVAEKALGRARVEAAVRVFEEAAAIAEGAAGAGDAHAEAHRAYWRRESRRAPAALPCDPRFGESWVRAVRAYRRSDPGAPLPAGVVPEMLDEASAEQIPKRYAALQTTEGLRLAPASTPIDVAGAGSWLGSILAGQREIFIDRGLDAPTPVSLDDDTAIDLPGPPLAGSLDLVTDVDSLRLEAWKQPVWASAVGRDGYGLWAAFNVGGVEQRMRWMPPGRFRMGSPKSEDGRREAEGPVHEVALTEGYWLAEVPCTQALWQAVMGGNPSRFESPNRPVEQVSWADSQRFVDRLNFQVRGLEVELPSEAEWEYACRAGSESATWRGNLEIAGANNAPLLDDTAWYGGNSGLSYDLEEGADSSRWPEKQHAHTKAGTREVGQKAANPWGLHDMLGNVWEWCWDRWGSYEAAAHVNPEGPEDGPLRVIRGGSWVGRARYVRAADRFGIVPGDSYVYLGFRLSRGPQDGGAEVEPGRAASAAVRRGTSRRARSRRARAWVERLGWAADGGVDAYGRWAAIEVGGARHRLRWIYPGRFLMGSPKSEDGRYADEGPRHTVTLTEGFWLGETPCTQDLWQAVMGSNPSRFQTPDRPVEQVSWEDCSAFFDRLSSQVDGFRGRLPAEAQWEYACRAGTEPATWLGDLEILGERNAPLLDTIAWYGGNSGVGFELDNGYDSSDWDHKQYDHTRTGTRPVAGKLPNPWGLYDMLGNVWEWCSDRWDFGSGYPGEARVDPEGTDGSSRVIRGGSWHAHARSVRAACRIGNGPGIRYDYLGFRLSRGPNENERA